jgi:hypothetical protein
MGKTEIIDGMKFRIGSDKHKIYKDYYKLGKTNTKDISQETGIPQNSVSWYLSKFRKNISVSVTRVQASEEVNQTTPENTNYNSILNIEIKEEEDGLYIYVRTSKEFENYVKSMKEVKLTSNLFGTHSQGKYYQFKLVENYLDDINVPIFYLGQLNFAILRVIDISKGLKFKISNLMTETQIRSGLTKLSSTFKNYYKVNIDNIKKDFKLEVLEEK